MWLWWYVQVASSRFKKGSTSRTLIYCQSRKEVTDIYESFLALLPQSSQKHVNMFHSTMPNDVQHQIIDSFSKGDDEVRVLISTIAYGMGIDVRGVNRTVIWGHPSDLDDYVQMRGRIRLGRNSKHRSNNQVSWWQCWLQCHIWNAWFFEGRLLSQRSHLRTHRGATTWRHR